MTDERGEANDRIGCVLLALAAGAWAFGGALTPATWVFAGIGLLVWWRRKKRTA